jgi:S1-C subfamily serine protease
MMDHKKGPAGEKSGTKRTLRSIFRGTIPFLLGVLITLAGIYLVNHLTDRTQALTINDVNDAIEQALQSATPPASYSSQVYQSIEPSIVLIQTEIQSDGEDRSGRIGSGVIITDFGDILTSLHVVDDASLIRVIFADGSVSNAQIVAAQPEIDIAVLEAEQLPAIVIPAVLGNPNLLSVGDEAFVVGNPFGLYSSMSAGVISGFNRSFQAPNMEQAIDGLIQIDTAVNPGNSGGPLLNRDGHVVGIVVGILNPVEQEFFVGIGFAVPITTASGAIGAPFY